MNSSAAAVLAFVILIVASSGCMGFTLKSPEASPAETVTPAPTIPQTTEPQVTTPVATPVPTTLPDEYPGALKLKEFYNFSSGKTASQGTVYRYWLNDTYQIFDPRETRYVTRHPAPGNRYLILFVNTVNRGTARNLPVKSTNIIVHFDGMTFFQDPAHTLPKTTKNVDSPPEIMRIGEIEFLHKLFGSEYVEDFGYSHGAELAYLTPGESNAIDGYIVYQVPASLVPERTYVEIPFNSQDVAVWKLS